MTGADADTTVEQNNYLKLLACNALAICDQVLLVLMLLMALVSLLVVMEYLHRWSHV